MNTKALFLLLCIAAATVFADTPIFMSITGISGESNDSNHNGWIDVNSYSHCVSYSVPGPAHHSDLTVNYTMDKSAPVLNIRACDQQAIPQVIVEVTQAADPSKKIYAVTLTDARVSQVQTDGSTNQNTVSVSFTFGSIEWQYTPYDEMGLPQTPITACWNVTNNMSCP